MCWHNKRDIYGDERSETAPTGPRSGDIREHDGTLIDRSPVWGEPRPRPWPRTVN